MVNPVSGNWRPRWTVGVQCPAKRKPECKIGMRKDCSPDSLGQVLAVCRVGHQSLWVCLSRYRMDQGAPPWRWSPVCWMGLVRIEDRRPRQILRNFAFVANPNGGPPRPLPLHPEKRACTITATRRGRWNAEYLCSGSIAPRRFVGHSQVNKRDTHTRKTDTFLRALFYGHTQHFGRTTSGSDRRATHEDGPRATGMGAVGKATNRGLFL